MSNFTGNEGSLVNIDDASSWTADFREAYPEYKKGYFLGKNKLNDLLNQTDCVGIRIYFAIKDGELNIVVVGAKANKDDITTNVLDVAVSCPDQCGASNRLNS